MTSKVKEISVNANELAHLLSLTPRHLENLISAGLPFKKVGRIRKFNLRESFAWFIHYKSKPTRFRDEVDQARARKLHLESDQLARSLVPGEVFYKFSAQLTEALADRIEILPSRVAGKLNEELLDVELRDLRTQLARDIERFDLSSEARVFDAPAAEEDDEPMGRSGKNLAARKSRGGKLPS